MRLGEFVWQVTISALGRALENIFLMRAKQDAKIHNNEKELGKVAKQLGRIVTTIGREKVKVGAKDQTKKENR